jgi:hypothetical protein
MLFADVAVFTDVITPTVNEADALPCGLVATTLIVPPVVPKSTTMMFVPSPLTMVAPFGTVHMKDVFGSFVTA